MEISSPENTNAGETVAQVGIEDVTADNVARVEPAEPTIEQPAQNTPQFGFQPDGSYLTPYNTTFFYRPDFFQSCLAGLIERVQAIQLSEQVDWKTLHETPQFITPHVVIFDGADHIPLADLAGFVSRGFQRVIVYTDRIDDYAAEYIELVSAQPAAAKIITANNVDLFFDTFITSGSAFTIVLLEDLLRDRYGKRMDIDVEELEETKFLMHGVKFGRTDEEAAKRFLEIAAAGYRMGEKRAEMIIRGQALMDSLHHYAHVIAHTATPAVSSGRNILVVWINTFLLKSLRKPLLEHLIMRAADSDTDYDFALCLHPIKDKISVNVLALAEKTIPAYNGKETAAEVLTYEEFGAWWPGVLSVRVVVCTDTNVDNTTIDIRASAADLEPAAE